MTEPLELEGYSDSNYATDPDSRRSITGYIVMINRAVVGFKSVQQKTIALSSCEAELMAMVSCAQEMIFVKHILDSIGFNIKTPMKLYCDNRGAVYLANSWTIGGRTKHIDIRQYYLRDLKELKLLMYLWIKGSVQRADGFTKNVDGSTFTIHLPYYITDEE